MDSKRLADSINFFSKNLSTADSDALADLVEDFFTTPDSAATGSG